MKLVNPVDVEYIAHRLAKKMEKRDKTIANFGAPLPHGYENSLSASFLRLNRNTLRKSLVPKAAVLFYSMIKSHFFRNGNKRIAVITMLVFLHKNKKWLNVDNQQLYNFTKLIAQSDPIIKEEIIKAIEKFLKTYLVSI